MSDMLAVKLGQIPEGLSRSEIPQKVSEAMEQKTGKTCIVVWDPDVEDQLLIQTGEAA